MPATTRGPLPPGVYWRRRAAVLSVAVVLVLGLGKVLSLGSDGSSEETAEQAGATTLTSPTATVAVTETTERPGKKGRKGKKGQRASESATPSATATPTPVLPDPTGPCPDEDVFITPTVPSPIGGQDITVLLNLQTRASAACTWYLSPETMRLNIVSGPDKIWASKECPDAIPTQEVVVRLASVTQVPLVWNARRSDEDCSDRTAWALPGSYHARAAVLGGEPTDVQFELVPPAPATVTQTAQPETPGAGDGGAGNATPAG